MAAQLLSLRLVAALVACAVADPEPGRIPKVYNALITSNQNLEPSKAYPVYQPVLHDAFAFSYQPAVFYGGDLIGNGLLPGQAPPPRESLPSGTSPSPKVEAPVASEPSPSTTEAPAAPEPSKPKPNSISTPAPPPPNTQSPIPLNEFGLPPQVLPLGHIDPIYNALPQFSPFTYRYPGVRFYDPYDPFGFNPYAGFPLYRPVSPLTNFLGPSLPVAVNKEAGPIQAATETSAQTPPPEPSDLNILNYSSKDPAIPNVPPPPLPQGGLKSDKAE